MPSGRAVFREVKESRPETDLLRAARFFYLLKCSTFGQAHSWLNKPLPRRGLGKRLAAFRRRMACVILECRPAEELLPIYDTPQTLFFLDPPYVGTGHLDSYANYTPEQLEALAKQVRGLKGRFVLTIDGFPLAGADGGHGSPPIVSPLCAVPRSAAPPCRPVSAWPTSPSAPSPPP